MELASPNLPQPRSLAILSRLALWPALIATLALYLPTLWYSWAADDAWYLVAKPWSAVPGMFNILDPTRFFYRPLSAVSYFLSYTLFGDNPAAWHAVNLLWYLACVYACFLLARRLLGVTGAMLGTLLFAIHPAHPGAVDWISSLSDVQAATFALLAAWLWLCYRDGGQRSRYLLTVASLGLALLSKEAATTMPFVIILGDLLFNARQGWRRKFITLLEYAGLLLPLAIYALLKGLALSSGGVILYKPWFLSDPGKLLPSTLLYILHSVGLPIYSLDTLGGFLSLLVVGLLVAVAWRLGKAGWCCLLWLLLTLAPVAISLQATNLTERTVFLPSVGTCLLLAGLLVYLYHRVRPERVGRLLVGATSAGLLLLAVWGTAVHSYDWYMAGEINARIIRDFRRLQPSLPADAIIYFRDVPYLYGNAYVVGNRGLNYMLRPAGSGPVRVIDKDFSTADKFCLPGNTLYFATAPNGSVTKLPDCQTWLNWQGQLAAIRLSMD